MIDPLKKASDFFYKDLWTIERSSLSRPRAFLVDALRFVSVIAKDLASGQITLWAMGLVYTTLLSLVPLLAVGFSLLKAFGVQNRLEPLLLDLVAPLGPGGAELTGRIVEFVDNIEVGVLGSLGLVFLIYTVISLIQKIEEAFNSIWKVRGLRSVLHRFSEYLSVVLVGPVLVVSALALTATFMSTAVVQTFVAIKPFGSIVAAAGKLVPYALIIAAFTFLYVFIPNTRVKLRAALAGGTMAGVLWESIGWGFASFIVSSTQYAAIYSSFAILILFLIWLYVSWLILLIGVEASFYYQNPQLLTIRRDKSPVNARLIEQAAISIMYLIGHQFRYGGSYWTDNLLVQRLGLKIEIVEDIVAELKKSGLITETSQDPPAYVPGRDISLILLRDILGAVRQVADQPQGRRNMLPLEPASKIMETIDAAIGRELGNISLRNFILKETGGRDVQAGEKN